MNLIAVTNRRLCQDQKEFLQRIAILAEELEEGDAILLREKDLSPEEYTALAAKCAALCRNAKARLIFHTHTPSFSLAQIHLHTCLSEFAAMKKSSDLLLSTSVHSAEEAKTAASLGAAFVIVGHIFPTDCKKGLPPRGLEFLRSVCAAVEIPVYAIGGITAERVPQVLAQGAAGVCVMSELMTCPDLRSTISKLKQYK